MAGEIRTWIAGRCKFVSVERFERLTVLKGDSVKGLPTSAWQTNLDDLDRDLLIRALIAAVRSLILDEWTSKRPDDRRPHKALEATEKWLANRNEDDLDPLKEAAKECTAARSETLGTDHRIPEAARACAWAVTAKDKADLWDGLVAVEGELLARVNLVAEYHRIPEQRKALLAVLKRVIEPPQEAAKPTSTGPVAYSASGNFTVGQKLTHVKFGDLEVTAAGDKWIDVKLPDGSIKRLAQKPK